MRLKEAAFIVGSMGGRPRIHALHTHREIRRGGFLPPSDNFYLLQEDGISKIILEDGTGFLLLEF